MENVFAYFAAIGAGLSVGLSLGALPAYLAYRWWIKKRGGDGGRAYQTTKTRT